MWLMGNSIIPQRPLTVLCTAQTATKLAAHYNDVIMSAMASQITSLTIVYSGADQENTKAPRHWPLWGEFTGDREFPAQRASNVENVSILMTSSCACEIIQQTWKASVAHWILMRFAFTYNSALPRKHRNRKYILTKWSLLFKQTNCMQMQLNKQWHAKPK